MAKDVIITPLDGDIQFSNASGTDAGKIEQSGDDLVISNAVGDVLLGDGTADVYIGDGIANVDIVFEQNGSIRGEAGGTVALTLGSSDTTLKLGSDLDVNGKSIVSSSNGDITIVPNGTGNVGIGQTSPTVPLEVIGTIKQKTGSGYTNYVQQSVSEAQLTFSTYSNNESSFPSAIKFSPGGTEAVRIDSVGRVGIGTTTPDTKFQVEFNGSHTSGTVSYTNAAIDLYNPLEADTDEKGSIITFSDNYYDSVSYNRTTRAAIKGGTDTTGNTANGFLAFYTDSASANSAEERMRINKDGNVGIGTATPSTKLDVNGVITATSGTSTNWNTAYGWGNHASAGYISNVVEDTTPQLGGTLDANGNTIDMGTYSITDAKVGQWDTAYGWGNHASAGYLTSETSHADVVVDGDFTSQGIMLRGASSGSYSILTDNSSNWNTAYGWGNHASAGYISNLSEDTTPQLGGNLDVNGSSIVSASNGHIALMPNGTGKVGIGTTSPSAKLDVVGDVEVNGQITINDEFNPYTLPAADGTSGQVLQTNGSGTLSFVTLSSGVTASGTPLNNQLAVWTTSSEIEGDNNLLWTGTQFTIGGGAILSADLIKMNGRAPTSPAAGEVGAGGNVITQFHTSGTVTAGGVYVAGSSAWVQADADAGSTATGLLAVATDAASAAEMLIEGSVKLASNTGFSTASKGDVLYLSLTAGELTSDISGHTTGDFVRVCGYVIDASKNYVYFKPDNTWLEL